MKWANAVVFAACVAAASAEARGGFGGGGGGGGNDQHGGGNGGENGGGNQQPPSYWPKGWDHRNSTLVTCVDDFIAAECATCTPLTSFIKKAECVGTCLETNADELKADCFPPAPTWAPHASHNKTEAPAAWDGGKNRTHHGGGHGRGNHGRGLGGHSDGNGNSNSFGWGGQGQGEQNSTKGNGGSGFGGFGGNGGSGFGGNGGNGGSGFGGNGGSGFGGNGGNTGSSGVPSTWLPNGFTGKVNDTVLACVESFINACDCGSAGFFQQAECLDQCIVPQLQTIWAQCFPAAPPLPTLPPAFSDGGGRNHTWGSYPGRHGGNNGTYAPWTSHGRNHTRPSFGNHTWPSFGNNGTWKHGGGGGGDGDRNRSNSAGFGHKRRGLRHLTVA